MLLRNSHLIKSELSAVNKLHSKDVNTDVRETTTNVPTTPRKLATTPQKRRHPRDLIEEESDHDKENESPNIRVSDEFDDLHEKQLRMTPRRHSTITPKRQLRRRLRRRSCKYCEM